MQVGSVQTLPAQSALRQSLSSPHLAPVTHGAQEPPQSTSASLPLSFPSVQVGSVDVASGVQAAKAPKTTGRTRVRARREKEESLSIVGRPLQRTCRA